MPSSMPAVSPALTRLQYSESNCAGCSRNACDRLEPASTRPLISIIKRAQSAHCCVRGRRFRTPAATERRTQHRRELAREKGDVLLTDPAAAAERLPLDLDDADALAAQIGRHDRLGRRLGFAPDLPVVAVDAFPDERVFLDVSACRGGAACSESCLEGFGPYSLVTASISSSEVMPCLTLRSPDFRRSRMPSFRAWSAMSIACRCA